MAIRKEVCKALNRGTDFASALAAAQKDTERHGPKRKNEDGQEPKGKKRKSQKERMKEQLAAAGASAASSSTQNQKGQQKGGNAKGKGKGGKKGGADSLPTGSKLKTPAGDGICINWNKNKDCANANCSYKHVCWFCFKDNHRGCERRFTQS